MATAGSTRLPAVFELLREQFDVWRKWRRWNVLPKRCARSLPLPRLWHSAKRDKVSIDILARVIRLTHQLPVEITTHLPLHLVHLLQREHLLADDAPTLIAVGVIAYDLGGNHESRDEKPVS
jgi:hypothetical protein